MSGAWVAASGWAVALPALGGCALLRRAGARRAALVAQAVHELRGPLGAAMLGLHGAGAGGRIDAVELELRRAGLALADLDAAPRGRRARAEARPLEVGELLEEAERGWRALADAFGVRLVLERPGPGLSLVADRLRLAQAVGNLVANALEHGAGPVRVRAHATRTHVRIEVRDQGPGLPAPVARLAGRSHGGRRGHGLGVAARVASAHGGRLLTAPVSRGACVVLELRRCEAAGVQPGRRRARLARVAGEAWWRA